MTVARFRTLQFTGLLALSLGIAPGCGDDKSESGTESGSGETEQGTETDVGGSNSESESSSTTGPVITMVPAKGISITNVEANQGTRVDIAIGDAWSDGSTRSTFLVNNRDTLVRVHFSVEDGYVPRDVEARLILTLPNGEEATLTQLKTVDGGSHEGNLESTFYFSMIATEGHTEFGTKFRVELWEEESVSQGTEMIPTTPATGSDYVGFENDPMELKIVLVPIHYTGGGQNITAEVTEQDELAMNNWLHENNPVQNVQFQIHDPITFGQPIQWLSPVLEQIAQLRQQENPPANVYYHGLLDQNCQFTGCTQGGGLLGQAIDIPGALPSQAYGRIAASMYYKPGGGLPTDMTLETIVHEHGHTGGFMHVFCPNGGAAGTDPSYPDANGRIQAWGFGIKYFSMHNPTAEFDYMTYCRPQWFGPWNWNKAYERVKTLTSWDYGGGAPGDDTTQPILIGSYRPDGSTNWWTADGGLFTPRISASDKVEFKVDGEWVTQPAEIRELSDSSAYWVITPLPSSMDDVESIRHIAGETSSTVDRDGIKVLHRNTNYTVFASN